MSLDNGYVNNVTMDTIGIQPNRFVINALKVVKLALTKSPVMLVWTILT